MGDSRIPIKSSSNKQLPQLADSLNADHKHCYNNYSAFIGNTSERPLQVKPEETVNTQKASDDPGNVSDTTETPLVNKDKVASNSKTDWVDNTYYGMNESRTSVHTKSNEEKVGNTNPADGEDTSAAGDRLQKGTNHSDAIVDNTYYEGDGGVLDKGSRLPSAMDNTDAMVDNTYYEGGRDVSVKGNGLPSATGHAPAMVDNTYYEGDGDVSTKNNRLPTDLNHIEMTENIYYGDEGENQDNTVKNNYYESQMGSDYPKNVNDLRGGENCDGENEHYYDLQEYKPKETKVASRGKNKPVVKKKPKPAAKPKQKKGLAMSNGIYAFTYHHFPSEGRQKEPKHMDSNI